MDILQRWHRTSTSLRPVRIESASARFVCKEKRKAAGQEHLYSTKSALLCLMMSRKHDVDEIVSPRLRGGDPPEKDVDSNNNTSSPKSKTDLSTEDSTSGGLTTISRSVVTTATTTGNQSPSISPSSEERSTTSTATSKSSTKINESALEVTCESPSVQFTGFQLAEGASGVNKKDLEGNENFDPRFFRNQIAVYQHDATQRPQSGVEAESRIETNAVEFYVVAKRVAQPKDLACWVTVRQLAHLGSGTFSDVYLGNVVVGRRGKAGAKRHTPVPCAIKKLWPDRSREDMQISTHRILHHHNIVELMFYYVCVHPKTKTIVWTLLMEPMPATMLHEQTRLSDQGRLMRQTYIKVFIYQTLSGLAYLERKNVLHRDIKPENLLVDMESGQLKIGDFGSSKHYCSGMPSSPYQVTRYYRAPELCLKYRYYGPTVDVWAAGCILCQLLTNRTLFYGRDNDDQLLKIISVCGTPTRDQIHQCAPGVDVNPMIFQLRYPPANWYRILHRYNERVTIDCADFVSRLLRYESNLRLRGENALSHPFFDSIREPGKLLPNGRSLPVLSL